MSDEPLIHECGRHDCFMPTNRRRFLRDTFFSVASALVALGMHETTAYALPLEFTEATRGAGSTRRYAIPATDGAQIDKGNEVILVRWQNAVYAFALSCPHQSTPLRWSDRDRTFECSKHHSKFTATGTYIADSGRATRNMDRLAIQRDGAFVIVDLDKVFEEDTDGAQWAAAVVKLN